MPASPLRVHFQGSGAMERFRKQVGETLWDVDATSSNEDALRLSLEVLPLGTMAITQRFLSGAGVLQLDRGRERIDRARDIAFGVCVVSSGTSALLVDGRSLEVGAGSMYFMNASAPFRKIVSADYSENFVLAHPDLLAFGRQGYMREPVLVSPIRGPAALLAEHMQSLLVHGAHIDPSTYGSLSAVLLGLVDATFSARTDDPEHRATVREARRQRIERFLQAHLHDPTLTPTRIAAVHRVSLRYLNELFETSERSLCATLLELRLQACMRALEAGSGRSSIGHIAYCHGFVSHAHFSRSFKARFGATPSEVRAAARRENPPPAPARSSCA